PTVGISGFVRPGQRADTVDAAGVTGQWMADRPFGDRVPDAYRPVLPDRGEQGTAVGLPGFVSPGQADTPDDAGVAGQRLADRLAGDRVPDAHGSIEPGGREECPAVRPSQRAHAPDRTGVAEQQVVDRPAGDGVPDAHGAVEPRGGEE